MTSQERQNLADTIERTVAAAKALGDVRSLDGCISGVGSKETLLVNGERVRLYDLVGTCITNAQCAISRAVAAKGETDEPKRTLHETKAEHFAKLYRQDLALIRGA